MWSLGFRPFYLLASLYAAVSVAAWGAQYTGLLGAAYFRGAVWHGHEMLFGYAMAVIAGFLFTAVRNWTGQPTPSGGALGAYVALWLAGRVLVLTPYGLAAAIANAAFPIAVAAGIAIPMAKSRNRRNYFFVALLVLEGCAALALHLSSLEYLAWPERASLRVGLDLVLFIVAVVSGRVVPMFNNNGVPGAGALHSARLWLWHPWRTLRAPLVWILHASYAWIAIHLVLRALASLSSSARRSPCTRSPSVSSAA